MAALRHAMAGVPKFTVVSITVVALLRRQVLLCPSRHLGEKQLY